MVITQSVLMFVVMLLLATLAEPLARRLFVPFSAMLVLIGFVGSELVVMAGYDTGLRWNSFHVIVMHVLLPVLIFESAFNMNVSLLFRNLVPTLILAIPLMLVTVLISAGLMFYGFGHPTGFPWIAAFICAALLSATDPVAVLNLFREIGAPERLTILVDGEGLFNDATAIVVFSLFLSLALGDMQTTSVAAAVLEFSKVFFGGIAVGLIIGLVGVGLFRYLHSAVSRGAMSLSLAYAAYLAAELSFGLSGVMSVLVAGLLIGRECRAQYGDSNDGFVSNLWEFNAWVASAIIFLLVGVTVQLRMFEDMWLAMLIGIGAALIARAVAIYAFVPMVSLLPRVDPISTKVQTVMYWGGVRGAVSLALALSLPLELDYWYTIQSIAYGVVLFTLFVQAPTMPLLLHWLAIDGNTTDSCEQDEETT